MNHLDIRTNLVVPNVSWGAIWSLHECDLLSLTKTGYATEIEIKVSKADLLKDKEKAHGHKHNHIKYLYFAVPHKLEEVALAEIPERAGLLTVEKEWVTDHLPYNGEVGEWFYYVKERRYPSINNKAIKWTDEQRYKLARLGAMRIHGLKKKLMSR